MPLRDNWNYKGFTIGVDPQFGLLAYQTWLSKTHVLAAASLSALFKEIDAYVLRVAEAA